MTTRILTFLFLLVFGLSKGQNLSTVFIDTLDITVNNKKIYSTDVTTLKFITNTKDIRLSLYDDGIHKLFISFAKSSSNRPYSLISSSLYFYLNDTSYSLAQMNQSNYEHCLEVLTGNCVLQNWGDNKLVPELKTKIKLNYRHMNFAPIDTTNYKFNYRQGTWIGTHRDVKEVTVDFQKDKRNGLARALYHDGTSYNVNFQDDIPDNYGQGYWQNYGGRNKFKFSYNIPNILLACDSENSNAYSSFTFQRGKKTKEVLIHHDLSVHYEKKGLQGDSLEFHVRGDYMSITDDSLVIQSDELNIHDFYKKNTDSLHYFSKMTPSSFIKVPIKDISKIYYERSEWKTFTLRTTLLSITTALIISPLVSIQKGGFNRDRFNKVTLTSFGVAILSISFGIAFSQKEFLCKPTKKSNKIWTIKPTDY